MRPTMCSLFIIFAPATDAHDIVVRLKKHIFIKLVCSIVAVLFVVRLICQPKVTDSVVAPEVPAPEMAEGQECVVDVDNADNAAEPLDFSYKHPIYSVHSYKECFPDLQDLHYEVASVLGVQPVQNREEAERRKDELVYVGASPFYHIDDHMSKSIPYLVPRASLLLHDIGCRFLDSLAVKRIPLHTIIVTSVLRTEDDVTALRRINGNASEQSCHRFGTTFDISYSRYRTVAHPDQPTPNPVRNDSLKFVLSEVLRDLREAGRCYVKHEVKQGCFHITVR